MQSTYDKGCDELTDESGAIDICAHCAAENKLQPGLYFCFQCGPFGRYICGDCHKQHRKFLNEHEIRDVSAAAKQPRRISDTLETKSLEIYRLCNHVHGILTGEQNELVNVKSSLDCLTSSLATLKKLMSVSDRIKTRCTKLHKALTKDQSQPKSSIDCLKGAYAALKNVKKKDKEMEAAKQVCNHYSDVLQATYTTMLEIFHCTESPLNDETLTEETPAWMHGLIIVMKKINEYIQHSQERQFVGSGPFFQILGKMHFDIMHEQYKKDNELQVVGQKSQRRTDNVQGNSTDDQTSIVTEICERVTQRYNVVKIAADNLKQENFELKSRSANEEKTRKHVAALRQIAFGSKTEDIQSTVGRGDVHDVASQLEQIAAKLQPLEKLSEKIEQLCSDIHLALTGEQIRAEEEKSLLGYLTGSCNTLQKLVTSSSEFKELCMKMQKASPGEQIKPSECLNNYRATLQKLKQANREVESATKMCDKCVDVLQNTHQTLSDIFQYNEPEMSFKKITENKPQRMHGLIIVVTKINNCVDYHRGRHFVDSDPILRILENMQVSIVHEQPKKLKEPRGVGQNSQRRPNSVQGNTMSDPTSIVEEICRKVTNRYAEVEEVARSLENEKFDLLNRLEKNSSEIERLCSVIQTKLTREQAESKDVKSSLDYLKASVATLQKLDTVSSDIEKWCTTVHTKLIGEQTEPKSCLDCLKGSYAALTNMNQQRDREVESAKEASSYYSTFLGDTFKTVCELFHCKEPQVIDLQLLASKPQWMHGLIVVLTKIHDCVDINRGRQLVESGPILKILGKTLDEHYTTTNEQQVVGRKSQRKPDNVQGETTNDPTSLVVDACEKLTRRYIEVKNAAANLEKEKQELLDRYSKVKNSVENLETEKAELLNRLLKIAGANLTNNNPNIADLSDPNRPTKLAEMYSELYDNAWTDAYEVLEKSRKGKEHLDIQFLFDILSELYRECADISKEQLLTIVMALTEQTDQEQKPKGKASGKVQLTTLQSKNVTELRKQSADIFVKSLQSYFEGKYRKDSKNKRSSWFDKGKIQTYTTKCIELCWLMHVQAPPVYIDLVVKPGDKFDTNKFKQYMKSGNKIDFVVWPPLLLHEGGPLLCKGVAQGK